MPSRTIAAFVAAALLSFALPATLLAQKPTKPDTTQGYIGPSSGQPNLQQLLQMIDALRKRVSALESEVAKMDKSDNSQPKMGAKFQAPFTVVDEDGKMIFTVSDDQYSAAFSGRVHIGPASTGNYNVWFHNKAGAMTATMGESRTGSGLVAILKGGQEIGSLDEEGLIVRSSAGKQIGHIGADPSAPSRGRIVVRGTFHLQDEAGNTTVDAGTLSNGQGAVRAWPNANCKASALPACIKGN